MGFFFLSAVKEEKKFLTESQATTTTTHIHIYNYNDCTDSNSANVGRFLRLYKCGTRREKNCDESEKKNKKNKSDNSSSQTENDTFRTRLLGGYWIFSLLDCSFFMLLVCTVFPYIFFPQIHAGLSIFFTLSLFMLLLVSLSIIIMIFEVFTTLQKVHWLKLFSLVCNTKNSSHSG